MSNIQMPKTNFQKVQEFNRAFDMVPKEPANYPSGEIDELGRPQIDAFIHIRPKLFTDSPKIIKLRLDLIDEEIEELNHAIEISDFIETRDALSDILYVVYGMADVLGINIDTLFYETRIRNNMISFNAKNYQVFCNSNSNSSLINNLSNYINQDETNDQPIGISNFDAVRYIYDAILKEEFSKNSMEYNLKIIQGYINENYKILENYCLSDVEKNLESFKKIGDYIYNLLKYVYMYSYIAGINANTDFGIVHSSNMSKLCDTQEDAIATVADYIEKYKAGKSPYDSPYYYELPELGKWIVKNKSTGKALKNIKYKKVDFFYQ